ncbi:MAG: cytochrome c peroxidase [Gemmatimonadaceae bacterium]
MYSTRPTAALLVALVYMTATNRVTDRGATLGRVLFHDRQLSINGAKSCANCHESGMAFTDVARLSVGFDGVGRTTAHAMRLANARFYTPGQAFWDRRAATLEAQATQPVRNAVEMGYDDEHGGIDALITKMRSLAYYPELFTFVYGDATITEDRIQRAVAQYVRSIVSVNSKFDQGFAQVFNSQTGDRGLGAPFPGYTQEENRGKQIFLQPPNQGGGGCAACHVAPAFALDANSRSNGLDAGETRIFKAPSLKNVAVTGPYMHDGRFDTLDQVVQFYISGIQGGPALDNRLRGPGGQPQRLQLSGADKTALVAFLRTLTDNTLAADARFANPFKQ